MRLGFIVLQRRTFVESTFFWAQLEILTVFKGSLSLIAKGNS